MTSFPTTLLVDTTNVCNARCPFCPLFEGDSKVDRALRPATIMNLDLYTKIMEEVSAWEVKPIDIVHSPNGECLQDPKILSRLHILKHLDLATRTTLLTNGQYLSPQTSEAILTAGISKVCVGFDGATKEVYEAHRVRCSYEKVLGNILEFVRLRSTSGGRTSLEIKFVRTQKNEHEVQAAWEMFHRLIPGAGTLCDALAVDWSDTPAANGGLYAVGKTGSLPRRAQGCSYYSTDMQVHADGKVAACCWDYNLVVSSGGLGDAAKENLLDVWRGTRRAALGKRVNGSLPPSKCQDCLMLHEIPQGTPKMAGYISSGPTSFIYQF